MLRNKTFKNKLLYRNTKLAQSVLLLANYRLYIINLQHFQEKTLKECSKYSNFIVNVNRYLVNGRLLYFFYFSPKQRCFMF